MSKNDKANDDLLIMAKWDAARAECNFKLAIGHIEQLKKLKRSFSGSAEGLVGRPVRDPVLVTAAGKEIARWVEGLMRKFEVKSCSALARCIEGSSERNWRRWLAGTSVPSASQFLEVMKMSLAKEVAEHHYEILMDVTVDSAMSSRDIYGLLAGLRKGASSGGVLL
ncbi:MAG: hypothetical protein WC742_13075 [Gallionellaceae bacterium]